MSGCQVVYCGQLGPGFQEKEVRQNLVRLFKTSEAHIDAFFSGARVVIKRGLSPEKAEQYRLALAKAGAIAFVESASDEVPIAEKPMTSDTAPVASHSSATSPVVQSHAERSNAVDVSQAVAAQVDEGAVGSLKATEIAPLGTVLSQPELVPPLMLDLSHLTLLKN